MKEETRHDCLVRFLKARGYEAVRIRTLKYTAMRKGDEPNLYFVGKGGALRHGSHVNGSSSMTGMKVYGDMVKSGAAYLADDQAVKRQQKGEGEHVAR